MNITLVISNNGISKSRKTTYGLTLPVKLIEFGSEDANIDKEDNEKPNK